MAQLVAALLYKPEGRAFYSLWSQWDFLLITSLRPHYNPVVDWTTNKDKYQRLSSEGKDGHLYAPIV